MKKLGLMSLVLAGAAVSFVGCTSTTSPETAQTSHSPEQADAIAQAASTGQTTQGGAAVQVDPTLQQSDSNQVNPMGGPSPSTQRPNQ